MIKIIKINIIIIFLGVNDWCTWFVCGRCFTLLQLTLSPPHWGSFSRGRKAFNGAGSELFVAPWVFRVLPRCWAGVLGSSTMGRPTRALDSASVGVCGGACGLSAGAAGRASLHGENPAHVAWASTCWPSRCGSTCSSSSSRCGACSWWGPCRGGLSPRGGTSSGSDWARARLARRRNLARPLALGAGHEVVAVTVATSVPEVHALGGDDVEVVAGNPVAAGAGSTRQGADGALNCSRGTEGARLPTCSLAMNIFDWNAWRLKAK